MFGYFSLQNYKKNWDRVDALGVFLARYGCIIIKERLAFLKMHLVFDHHDGDCLELFHALQLRIYS